jgi:predicted nucleic acid-binding protein
LSLRGVVYDACVLYPAPLRDTLVSLATTRLFHAHWTDAIHDEWIRSLLMDRPDISPQQLARTRSLMNRAVPDALITGYERLIDSLVLPDPNDRHVLAAAIHAKASVIVTFNERDFPPAVVRPLDIDVCQPDMFSNGLMDEAPLTVVETLAKQRSRLINPVLTAEDFLDRLDRQGLSRAVIRLRAHTETL